MAHQVVHTAQYHEQRKLEGIGARLAAEKAAKQAEIEHRSKPRRHFDDDEMLAMCGLPPRRH